MNMTLSENRANSVREFFANQEIAGSSSPVFRSGRRSRSLSNALLSIASSCGGRSGFKRTGARLRIAAKITALVSPRKGSEPLAIW